MCRAWAPGHTTLFFAVPDKFEKISLMGSIGGGLNFEEGVITEVKHSSNNEIYWNKKSISGKVSLTSIDLFNKRFNLDKKYKVYHSSKIPIGYGLSTSGAGSISTLLALKALNKINVDNMVLFKMAHEAEIIHHTGLGSVVGQVSSGIELRKTQGDPEICDVRKYYEDIEVVLLFFGPLDTSKIITSREKMIDVTNSGIEAVKEASKIEVPTVNDFIKIGNEFTNKCGLLTDRMGIVMKELAKINENKVAMAMIGETLVILPQNKTKLIDWINNNNYKFIETRIASKTPYILEN